MIHIQLHSKILDVYNVHNDVFNWIFIFQLVLIIIYNLHNIYVLHHVQLGSEDAKMKFEFKNKRNRFSLWL